MQRRQVEARVVEPREGEMRPGEDQAVLAAGDRRPGEDDDVEDLTEDERGDGKIDVAQAGRKIGDEQRRAGGAGNAEQDREPHIARMHDQQRRRRAIHAEAEKRRMAERDHAGVADQQIGRHRQQTPDQDFGQEFCPEYRQHQRCNDQQRHDNAETDPIDYRVTVEIFHLGVANRPVGLNSSVRISTTKDTITACEGFTQIEA